MKYKRKYLEFEEAKKVVHSLGIKDRTEWHILCVSGMKPKNIPENPEEIYEDWKSWSDWIGKRVNNHCYRYLPFKEARKIVRSFNIYGLRKGWNIFLQKNKRPEDIPYRPDIVYKKYGWVSWADWLGNNYLLYKDAKKIVHKLNLRTTIEWTRYKRGKGKHLPIPTNVYKCYRGKGWVNASDFLGEYYLPYFEAKKIVHKLKFKNLDSWKDHKEGEGKTMPIPSNAYGFYKRRGEWISTADFLGNGFLSYSEAKNVVKNFGLRSPAEWISYIRYNDIPEGIPRYPYIYYKKRKEWVSWVDFLGCGKPVILLSSNYPSFEEAREYARSLKLEKKKDWEYMTEIKGFREDMPKNPENIYRNHGWVSWNDWLGSDYVLPRERVFLSFEEAREHVRGLGIRSMNKWRYEYCVSGKKPDNIPSAPNLKYKDSGWVSWADWLGKEEMAH